MPPAPLAFNAIEASTPNDRRPLGFDASTTTETTASTAPPARAPLSASAALVGHLPIGASAPNAAEPAPVVSPLAVSSSAGDVEPPIGDGVPNAAELPSVVRPLAVPSSAALSPPPPAIAAPSGAEHELLVGAFGKALQVAQDRRARDVLEIVLAAEQEHVATVMHALAEQRREYGDQLERAVKRLSEELTSDSVIEIGELFHRSAGEITGALARGERYSRSLIEKQNNVLERLEAIDNGISKLLAVATEIRDIGSALASALPTVTRQRTPAKESERRLVVVPTKTDPLASIREDLDSDDDT
ncbi:hypothetical protein [Nannocystis pusilla]|uniref:hypothetical protein n=1 Tax=Nannocystis pusilla TaxID=889268 RepID=UPI003BF33FEB